jgi:phage shock protein A
MIKINGRCSNSSRKRYENNSKKWEKQLLEVWEANERVKSSIRKMKRNRKGYVEQQREMRKATKRCEKQLKTVRKSIVECIRSE